MADDSVAYDGEVWKPVQDFPDYQISNFGRVKSVTPRQGARARVNGGLIKPYVGSQSPGRPACLKVSFRKDGETFQRRVHRLVLEAFVGPCPDGMECCHNDGDHTNNRAENLRWDTHKANMHDQVGHGTKSKPPTFYGERHHNTQLTAAQVLEIRATPVSRGTLAALARQYNTSDQTIRRILDRKVWKHV